MPGEGRWGDPARIWPGGNPWVREKAELPELVADWCEHLEAEGFGKGVHKAFCGIADHLMSWMPGKDLFGKSKTMLIRAFEVAGVSTLSPFLYTQIVWVTIISILVFGQFPDEYSILGTCIVIGSGLYVWHRETKERRKVS